MSNYFNEILTGGYPTLALNKNSKFIEDLTKESKGFKSETIYVDGNLLSPRGYNRNMRYYNSKIWELAEKQYHHKIMNKFHRSLILNDMREFYSCLCKITVNYGWKRKQMYIVRTTSNPSFPYILTDDLRVIMYQYLPYKFKKEDIKIKLER